MFKDRKCRFLMFSEPMQWVDSSHFCSRSFASPLGFENRIWKMCRASCPSMLKFLVLLVVIRKDVCSQTSGKIKVWVVFRVWTFIILILSCSFIHACGYFWGELLLYISFVKENVSECYCIYLFYIFFIVKESFSK